MRLPSGGRIDRSRPLAFTFDGRRYTGYAGDTLASALLANGVHLVGRSFKLHRPRGILAAGVEEPNALVGIDRGEGRYEPNQRATTVPLHDGLVSESQNRWPTLRADLGAATRLIAPMIPAGFYYKTFMWPRRAWKTLYEPAIRRMAGLGRAPSAPDADRYAQRWAHCELLIVGGGPAGLAAALAASGASAEGRRVMLCDLDEEFGGSLLSDPEARIDGRPAWAWIEAAVATLRRRPNVTLLPRTTAFAYGIDNLVSLAERLTDHLPPAQARGARERLWLVRAERVVLATGAIERPLVFRNNDRPGVMLAGAAVTYVRRYGVLPGQLAVVCTDHDGGYAPALALARAGMRVAAIVDPRERPDPALAEEARAVGIEVLAGARPADTRGRRRVRAVRVGERWIACDLLLMAGGWTPSLHLFSQSRGEVRWSQEAQCFLPGRSAQHATSVGAACGNFALDSCLDDGWTAGGGGEGRPTAATARAIATPPARTMDDLEGPAFVDFQNDVTAKDIRLAVREGFHSIEHIKRYTTTGMATDQGRTSSVNALAIASRALDRPVAEVGLTTFRSPYTPTGFGTLVGMARGRLFDPERRTPTHAWAAARGAVFEDVGQWKRARYFPQGAQSMRAAVDRECLAVRASAGVFDASTLGKIEVVGPDAAEFLNRLYVNTFSKLGVERCRYGVLCREDGFVYDDGVIGRLATDRFHVTTTTGGAARVLHLMEDYRQTEFPELEVWLTSTTEQWGVIAVNGPRARDILRLLVSGIDLDGEAFPHMSLRHGEVAGVPARVFRVSFTGELGFEVNVPSSRTGEVWEAVIAAAREFGAGPYGTETMHVLRAEKGYIIVGQDTDGTVTPEDVGLGWAIGKNKPDFVGRRSLLRPAMRAPARKQLVGLRSADDGTVLEEGAQIVDPAGDPARSIGHVTSAYWSANLGRPIALALVRGGRARIGTMLGVATRSRPIPVAVVEPVFLDQDGARLHG